MQLAAELPEKCTRKSGFLDSLVNAKPTKRLLGFAIAPDSSGLF
jgi:hypothetical protein